MKKTLMISFVTFLSANICFSEVCSHVKIENLDNFYIQIFDGTNQCDIYLNEFVDFVREHANFPKCPKGPNGESGLTNLEQYVTNSFPTNFNLNDFVWEPDEKLKRLWGDYYNSPEKTDDSSEETFNGIPIVKGGPAKETILDCVIRENSSNSPIEHRLTILDHNGRRYDYENLVTNFIDEYSKYNFVQSTTNILINEFFETELDDLTWYYENFDGYVNVNFEVVGYGFSNTSKMALEEEIREAIQKIIDLHFPKERTK